MQLQAKYMTFYLDGRGDDLFDDDDIDVDDLVEKAWKGEEPRKLAVGVVENLAATLRNARERRAWLADNKPAIAEAGGDDQVAFDHYVAGRIDQHAMALEGEIVEEMFAGDTFGGDGDDDGDDDDDGDGEDE